MQNPLAYEYPAIRLPANRAGCETRSRGENCSREYKMKVPVLDLKSHHAPMLNEINGAIREVVESSAFAGGPFVERFEGDCAAYCNASHAAGRGSGTHALWIVR